MFRNKYSGSGRGGGNRRTFGRSPNFSRGNPRSQGSKIHSSLYVKKAEPLEVEAAYTVKNNFVDFNISNVLKENIVKRGYTTPTPIQDQIIPHALEGKDVVGIANTGTGKTAAFLIPLLNKIISDSNHKALIIAPTRELAIQIEEELYTFADNIAFSSVLTIGGASIGRQMHFLMNNPNIVIGTPGRLMDLTKRRALRLENFQTIVLDEVDRMVDIGFINDIKYLISLLPKVRQSMFFSATVPKEVNNIMQSFLTNPIVISVKTKETAENIEQDIIKVTSKEQKLEKLTELLSQREFSKVMVFGKTKWNVERLAISLQNQGFLAASIHGNKSQGQRLKALESFKQNKLQILVATDIAARGLDIEDVTHVINFDEPQTYTDYVHRIGRTGRANKSGKALTFVM